MGDTRRGRDAQRRVRHLALLLLAIAGLGLAGCSSGDTVTPAHNASTYAGLWTTESNSGPVWIHAAVRGDGLVLRWDRELSRPVVQEARVLGDGSLHADAVPYDPEADTQLPAYEGHVTPDGELELTATIDIGGGNTTAVTTTLGRGTETGYAEYATRRDAELARQAAFDAFSESLDTVGSGVQAWRRNHGDRPPPAGAVRPGGAVGRLLKAEGKDWPRLGDGRQLLPGSGPGTFRYRPLSHGYRLSGTALDGQQMSTEARW